MMKENEIYRYFTCNKNLYYRHAGKTNGLCFSYIGSHKIRHLVFCVCVVQSSENDIVYVFRYKIKFQTFFFERCIVKLSLIRIMPKLFSWPKILYKRSRLSLYPNKQLIQFGLQDMLFP